MKFTGEQFVPELSKKRLIDEHMARYNFAKKYVEKRAVLDIASGTGYGSSLLSQKARKVTGVDLSRESIEYAKDRFQKSNIEFICASATDELFEDESFDVICSFETIEHLEKEDRIKYLKNLNKWLKKDGVLLLSTPNKKITSPFTKKPVNKFHVLEYDYEGLKEELSPYLGVDKFYGQRLIPKFYSYRIIRKIINTISRLINIQKIYTDYYSAEISEFNSERQEPRIFFVKCKKHD